MADDGRGLLRGIVRAQRRRVIVSSLGGASHQACEALVPVLIGVIVDRAIEPSDGGSMALWTVLLAVLFVVLNSSYRVQFLVVTRASELAEHDLRMRLTERVLDPGGIAGAGSSGELLSIASSDARRAVQVLWAIAVAAAAASALVTSAIFLIGISVPLGLLVLLGAPPALYGLHRLAAPLHRSSHVEQARAADAAGVATDLVRGGRVLKGIGAEAAAAARYRSVSAASLRASVRAAAAGNVLEAANVLAGGLLLALVALVGGRLAASGDISVGELVAAVGLTQFLIGPLQRVAWAAGMFAASRASAERAAAVLAAPRVVAGGEQPAPAAPRGELALRLAAGGGQDKCAQGAQILAIPSIEVAAGEHVGLVVPDPAEADALVDVLARRAGGDVRFDGVALDAFAIDTAHRLVLVADHDADLFEGSVADNVGAVDEAVLAAAGADEAVEALPGGLEAPVGERGRRLSGGQRQRIALARALAADAPVLVLHEPTTAVDTVTEARIAAGVRELRAGRTTLVIASSPALLAVCDRVLRGGEIVAAGTHAELAHEDATYREAVLR
jgi:putative ABC transport system ATP-binding protein